jgi:dTDP-4-amino-4,6-dideoxygalactose transaminase
MTEMQAVIGLRQLAKMQDWTETRTRNAMVWRDAVAGINGLMAPVPDAGFKHAYYKFYMYLDPALADVEAVRDRILAACTEAGLKVLSGSCSEVYLEKAFSDLSQQQLPAAHRLSKTSLMVEVHPTIDCERLKSRANWFKQIVQPILAGG